MKAILVTTEHRGVFAGLVPDDQDLNARTLRLEDARCAIYWSTTKGVAELASDGPNDKSRIGAKATLEALHDITAIWAITDEAWAKYGYGDGYRDGYGYGDGYGYRDGYGSGSGSGSGSGYGSGYGYGCGYGDGDGDGYGDGYGYGYGYGYGDGP